MIQKIFKSAETRTAITVYPGSLLINFSNWVIYVAYVYAYVLNCPYFRIMQSIT
jgi:hypothetical protein